MKVKKKNNIYIYYMKSKKKENKTPKKKGGSISDFFTNMLFIIIIVGIISFIIWLVYNNKSNDLTIFPKSTMPKKSDDIYNILIRNNTTPCESMSECWNKQYTNSVAMENLKNKLMGNNFIINTFKNALESIGHYIVPQVQNNMVNKSNNPDYGINYVYGQPQKYNPNKII